MDACQEHMALPLRAAKAVRPSSVLCNLRNHQPNPRDNPKALYVRAEGTSSGEARTIHPHHPPVWNGSGTSIAGLHGTNAKLGSIGLSQKHHACEALPGSSPWTVATTAYYSILAWNLKDRSNPISSRAKTGNSQKTGNHLWKAIFLKSIIKVSVNWYHD